jgi:hypothetical protein
MTNLPRIRVISTQQINCNGLDESCTFFSVQLLLYLELDALTAIVTNGKPDVSATLVQFEATFMGAGITLMFDLERQRTFCTATNVLTCLKL